MIFFNSYPNLLNVNVNVNVNEKVNFQLVQKLTVPEYCGAGVQEVEGGGGDSWVLVSTCYHSKKEE